MPERDSKARVICPLLPTGLGTLGVLFSLQSLSTVRVVEIWRSPLVSNEAGQLRTVVSALS